MNTKKYIHLKKQAGDENLRDKRQGGRGGDSLTKAKDIFSIYIVKQRPER